MSVATYGFRRTRQAGVRVFSSGIVITGSVTLSKILPSSGSLLGSGVISDHAYCYSLMLKKLRGKLLIRFGGLMCGFRGIFWLFWCLFIFLYENCIVNRVVGSMCSISSNRAVHMNLEVDLVNCH